MKRESLKQLWSTIPMVPNQQPLLTSNTKKDHYMALDSWPWTQTNGGMVELANDIPLKLTISLDLKRPIPIYKQTQTAVLKRPYAVTKVE
ncbi:MAG: hypothetical protein H0A76_13540 [Candidatus Thiodubiliella endoseptemdiera]|uniref:Uncharacterized protein n=1 Tax=Candidatus Thiodubiliella endoseptemdiera TaxID=2738886 RepID=A0A853F5I0_9GAMM|nr:hypothetical protein [Candidatus Thiodubiliella endoseptemdiera]